MRIIATDLRTGVYTVPKQNCSVTAWRQPKSMASVPAELVKARKDTQ